jgi:hypothetical protein
MDKPLPEIPVLSGNASLSCQNIHNNDWYSYLEGYPLHAYQISGSVK